MRRRQWKASRIAAFSSDRNFSGQSLQEHKANHLLHVHIGVRMNVSGRPGNIFREGCANFFLISHQISHSLDSLRKNTKQIILYTWSKVKQKSEEKDDTDAEKEYGKRHRPREKRG